MGYQWPPSNLQNLYPFCGSIHYNGIFVIAFTFEIVFFSKNMFIFIFNVDIHTILMYFS